MTNDAVHSIMGQGSDCAWQLFYRGGNRMLPVGRCIGALRRRELLAQQPVVVNARSDTEHLPGRCVMMGTPIRA